MVADDADAKLIRVPVERLTIQKRIESNRRAPFATPRVVTSLGSDQFSVGVYK
jgi:hypothetical protein